jgi:hypothetical protein
MASILSAGNSTNNGASLTGATDGILVIKTGTGAGTTAMTIDASQNVTFAGSLSASGGISGAGQPQMSFASYPTTVFNSTGTPMANTGTGTFNWTCPTGVTKVMVSVIAGGGGSGNGPGGNYGGPGGTAIGIYTVTPSTVYAVTVGAGGVGSGATGTAGGSSSFSSLATATGGTAGSGSSQGAGGAGSSGNIKNTPAGTAGISYYNATHIGFLGQTGVVGGTSYPTNIDSLTTAATNWSTSTKSAPGAAGDSTNNSGGTSGIVLITWVG